MTGEIGHKEGVAPRTSDLNYYCMAQACNWVSECSEAHATSYVERKQTVHHQSKSRALQLHPTPFKTWNFNFLLQLFWRRMISISTLHPTFHSFITAQQPWQSASNQSNHKVVFGALPYTSFWPISPRDCQQFLATIWQPVGEYKFSLVTSGYHGITDRSLGLCDWDLNLQSQDEEVNHLGV